MSQVQTINPVAQKVKPFRSRKYLDWVKSLPCVVTGQTRSGGAVIDPHHIIGIGDGRTGGRASDLLTFPLCREQHDRLHDDIPYWEAFNGAQISHVIDTMSTFFITKGLLPRPLYDRYHIDKDQDALCSDLQRMLRVMLTK